MQVSILLGTILLYIAFFGFSDYIVKKYKLEKTAYLIYYTVVLCIALFMLLPSITR